MQITATAPKPSPVLDNPQIVGALQVGLGGIAQADEIFTAIAKETAATGRSSVGVNDPLVSDLHRSLFEAQMGFDLIAGSAREPFNTPKAAADAAKIAVRHLAAATKLIDHAKAYDAELPSGHEMFVTVDTDAVLALTNKAITKGVQPMVEALGIPTS